jgi:hypothetical protein
MIARLVLALLLSQMAVSSAEAQAQFDVCEGQYQERCPTNTVHTGCGTIEARSVSLCQQFTGGRHVKSQYNVYGGNRCGYGIWKVVCQ